MTTITQTGRRMALVGLLALIAAMFPLTGASAQDGDVTLDLNGETNVEYAIAWSQVANPTPTPIDTGTDTDTGNNTAFIGRDDLFADNLASGVLQDAGPLLLTATNELSANTEIELNRLAVDDVTILGGDNAVDPAVEAELAENFTVNRLEGPTRIETAVAIAQVDDTETTAILARAYESTEDGTQAFADSLAAGAWAADAGYDVLLTQTEVLTGNTATQITEGGYESVIIVGGTDAVSQDVEDQAGALGVDVTRVAGDNRFETAVEIANERGFDDSADADVTLLVDGQASNSWADGFPAANIGSNGYPVVLANSADTQLPAATTDFLVDDGMDFLAHLSQVDLICGSSVPDNDGNDQCQEAADETGTDVSEMLPPSESRQTGIITGVDTGNDTVTFIPEGETDPVTEDFDPDTDTFIIDGEAATAEEFEDQADPGDTITVVDNGDGTMTFILENEVTSGTVGNVDLLQAEYDIIDPDTGEILRENIGFTGDTFTTDAGDSTEAAFASDINEGDTVVFTSDGGVIGDQHDLTNQDTTGEVTDLTVDATTSTTFTIDGTLGDDVFDGDDDLYVASTLVTPPSLQTYTVDGANATYTEFAAAISEGDTITYDRAGDMETFALIDDGA